jgi:hypothetical protein
LFRHTAEGLPSLRRVDFGQLYLVLHEFSIEYGDGVAIADANDLPLDDLRLSGQR